MHSRWSDKSPLLSLLALLPLGLVLLAFLPKQLRRTALTDDEPRTSQATSPAAEGLRLATLDLVVSELQWDFLELFGPVTLGLRGLVKMLIQRREALEFFYFCGRTEQGPSGQVLRHSSRQGHEAWIPSPELPTPRFAASAAVLKGEILVMGGFNDHDLDTCEKFNPVLGTWSRPPELQLKWPRSESATAVLDQRVYLMAGTSGGEELNLVECCDGRGWEPAAQLLLPLSGCGAAVTAGQLYLAGGFARGDSLVLFQRLDGRCWTQLAPLRTPRWSCAAVGVQGMVYVSGGYNGGVPLDSVDRYCPIADSWERVATLPTPRKHLTALAHKNTLYLLGGCDGVKASAQNEQLQLESLTWKTSQLPIASEWGTALLL